MPQNGRLVQIISRYGKSFSLMDRTSAAMKTIGLLGGMSWESTQDYYRLINQKVNQALGGLHSAQLLLFSLDFAPLEQLQHRGDWDGTADMLCRGAGALAAGGAGCVVLCTNTMHKVAPEIERAVDIPLLHIADATGQALQQDAVTKVGLLGTAFTMEQDFYRQRLSERFDLDVITPPAKERREVHRIIYEELCRGQVNGDSRRFYVEVIEHLAQQGARAVILGCTEIGLLVKPSDTRVPLYDTTELHAQQAVHWYLN